MNRRRMTDREWVEWVENGSEGIVSPYGRDDVWLLDRPADGECLFVSRERRGVELVLLMRDERFESRMAVSLSKDDARGLRDFLSARLEDMDRVRASLSDAAGRADDISAAETRRIEAADVDDNE